MARDSSSRGKNEATSKQVRVAIYTRKSTDEGLDREFNTLDAQRQAIEDYVKSQRGEGWTSLPERYDDGGFTGANTNRPAFQRLIDDIEAGKIDLVAVYKIDRLSRSLVDFARIIDFFEEKGIEFVSVTQQFSTANSIGKLTLNILMSFAEFERQVISERTRDKMAATRRKGMWTGGRPVLGFDVTDRKLVVNEEEAEQVREIYQLYLEGGSLLAVVEEVNRRGWRNKIHRARSGRVFGGSPFDKNSVRRILTHPIYLGKVVFDGETYEGEHEAIVEQGVWEVVQAQLEKHRRRPGNGKRHNGRALLGQILRCGACGASFSHNSTAGGNRRYRYYVCQTKQKQGNAACPDGRVSAPEIEKFIVEQIMAIGKDPRLVAKTARAARKAIEEQQRGLTKEAKRLNTEIRKLSEEKGNLLDAISQGETGDSAIRERLAEADESLQTLHQSAEKARRELAAIEHASIDEDDLRAALASFTPVWDELLPKEQARILHLLIEQVTYNAAEGKVQIGFRPDGIRILAAEHEEAQP